jgi:O-antigen/teichoic acid export membrane protein
VNNAALKPRSFLQASVLLFVCSNLANVFQFVFQTLMRRKLPEGDFSLMNSLFSSAFFVALPISIWQQIWIRKFAELRARGRLGLAVHYVKKMTFYCLAYALLAAGVLFLNLPLLKGFLNTDNNAAVSAFVMGIILTLALPMTSILLQGMQAFGTLAATAILTPLFRLALGFALLQLGWAAAAGVWATALQNLVPMVAAIWFLYHFGLNKLPLESDRDERHWKLGDIWVPGMSVIIATVLMNTDFILVQHLFDKPQADRFATAAIFGHSMVFFLMPISAVLLPKVVDHFEGWEHSESSVARKSLALSLVLAVFMAGVGTVLAPPVLKIFMGKSDPETLQLVRWFLWAMIPTSLASIGLLALVGRLQGRLVLMSLAAALVLPVLIFWRHENLFQVLTAHAIVGTLLLAIMVGGNLGRLKNAP